MSLLLGKKLRNVRDVRDYQLCSGCGACAYMQPDAIEMIDVIDHGRRPAIRPEASERSLEDALRVCPGIGLEASPRRPGQIDELRPAWGPVLAVFEGAAADPEIRFAGSSGGAASALALFAIERAGMSGVLHTAARSDVPFLNETVLSRHRREILANTGSRYAPASPCDRLDWIEREPTPCVFIGKPCDVAAAALAARECPTLAEKLGLTVAIFCAGTPSTRGTLEMLRAMGVEDANHLQSLRYRGLGWPGDARATGLAADGERFTRTLSYAQSWGEILHKHRQWRCYVCADHTGEFADVSVGDPWYRTIAAEEPGESLVLARTDRGLDLILRAMNAGYLDLMPATPDIVVRSQPNLLLARANIWGRTLVSRAMGAAAPRYYGLPSFRFWLSELTPRQKLQSLIGTARRVVRRGLRKRLT